MTTAGAAAALRANKALLVAAAKNGRAIPCDVDATKFLLSHPRGAYTAARTVDQTKIFDYEGHIKRLVDSTIAMHEATPAIPFHHVETQLRPRTEATLRAAMDDFKQQFGSEPKEEYKITVLVCQEEDGNQDATKPALVDVADIYCHIGLLPPLRSNLVKLQVAGMPRHNAAAKDSGWVRERKAIYDAIPTDVEEIILMDPDTHVLLEGSQTNFYAVHGGKVFTAEDGILKGTVRGLVLEMCGELGVPVVLEPPTLDTVESWDACFISSTSRLVLGAGSLEYDALGGGKSERKTRVFERSTILERLAEAVKTAVVRKSASVF